MRILPKNLVLAIDIGTTAMKGGLLTPEGEMVAYHRVTYWEKTRQDYHTWDPKVWIEALRDIVASLGGYNRISVIVVSGHGPTVIPVGENGEVLFPALLWLDKRQVRREGTRSFFLPKIAWFAQNQPLLFEKTKWFLSCPEYLDFFLTGEAHTVTPSQEFTPFIWGEEDVKKYDLLPGKLPPFVTTGEFMGKVRPQASYFTGIPAGIPVVAGGSDFLLSLLGSAVIKPGRTCDRAGTSEGINHCHSASLEAPGLRTLPHVIPGLYNISGILSSTGRLFEWLRKITGQGERSYRDILQDIENVPLDRSRPNFYPSFEWNGDFEFARGGFLELHPDHNRDDLGRAVVESIGFGIKRIVNNLETQGCKVEEIRVTGGQARNVIWNQMKADMTGRTIVVPEIEDAELLGGAVCALKAQGDFSHLAEASEALFRIRAIFNPREERRVRYQELFEEYVEYSQQMGR